MKYVIFLLLLLTVNNAYSQKVLKGTVLEQTTNKAIPAASVFLNNTSVGTTTNSQGYFELEIPYGKFDLIISSIGFETYNQLITSNDSSQLITIKLQPKIKDLEAVVVEPFLKDGWDEWGRFFLEHFIGTSAFSYNCKIKNTHAIKFRHSKKDEVLTAIALEPLIIENNALGYTIRYQLENFTYHFKDRYVFYEGYPFFEPMKGNRPQQKRWAKNRKSAYEGSMMHFMRSLYYNTITTEGFSINRLKKISNTEKQRVKELYKNATRTVQSGNVILKVNSGVTNNPDSSDYYKTVMRQPDGFDIIGKTQLTGDSIAFALDSTTVGFFFEGYLLVVYNKKTAPNEYRRLFPDAGRAMVSQITLLNAQLVAVEANGAYYHPSTLMSLGYWGWSEKIASLLPFDYILPESD